MSMSDFSTRFEAYMPSAWFGEAGLVDHDHHIQGAYQKKPQKSGLDTMARTARAALFAAAASVGILVLAPGTATAQTTYVDIALPSVAASLKNKTALDDDVLPDNYWPSAIARIKALPVLVESEVDDPEPLI